MTCGNSDYAATPGGGGQVGKATATGQDSIADAKFYVMNSAYEVFKCLYNGENPANAAGKTQLKNPSQVLTMMQQLVSTPRLLVLVTSGSTCTPFQLMTF